MSKKHKGYIRITWEDGSVDYRPVEPDLEKPIPTSGWVDQETGSIIDWAVRPDSDSAAREWWRAQDCLDKLAKDRGKFMGGVKRGAQKREVAENIAKKLDPLFQESYDHLIEEGAKRVGRKRLRDEALLRLKDHDRLKAKVTLSRAEAWVQKRKNTNK